MSRENLIPAWGILMLMPLIAGNAQQGQFYLDDRVPPEVKVTCFTIDRSQPPDKRLFIFAATAEDPTGPYQSPIGISEIMIMIKTPKHRTPIRLVPAKLEIAQTSNSSPCIYVSGPYPMHTAFSYYAKARDKVGNEDSTAYYPFQIEPEPPPPVQLYIPPIRNPYVEGIYKLKGQTHCHSTIGNTTFRRGTDDGPVAVQQAYQAKKYDFICLTEHNIIDHPRTYQDRLFHILSLEDGRDDPHHIIVLGIDYNKVHEYHVKYPNSIADPDENGESYWPTIGCYDVRNRLEYYHYVAGVTVLAHPKDESEEGPLNFHIADLVGNTGFYDGIEIYSGYQSKYLGFATDYWDTLLVRGFPVWGFGSDDCHNVENEKRMFNRSWIIVNSDRLPSYSQGFPSENENSGLTEHILDNIKKGNFYTVVRSPDRVETIGSGTTYKGPIPHISTSGDKVTVSMPEPSNDVWPSPNWQSIWFVTNLGKTEGPTGVNSASYTIKPGETYVRVEVRDGLENEIYAVYSQPLFVRQE
jgi:hypothetical protein